MRDPDAVMAHESEQQKLVEGIITNLHQETLDDQAYQDTFRRLAGDILLHLGSERPIRIATQSRPILETIVFPPIKAFTSSPIESRYLLLQVMKKVLNSVSSRISSDYLSMELGRTR